MMVFTHKTEKAVNINYYPNIYLVNYLVFSMIISNCFVCITSPLLVNQLLQYSV